MKPGKEKGQFSTFKTPNKNKGRLEMKRNAKNTCTLAPLGDARRPGCVTNVYGETKFENASRELP